MCLVSYFSLASALVVIGDSSLRCILVRGGGNLDKIQKTSSSFSRDNVLKVEVISNIARFS